VLYLAEVHKKTGFMGAKTELKLLARQQSEQNWSTLPGEEMIPVEIANEYNSGVLVLVELDANQQVKKVQDATRHLVGILKNFSRMRDKFRTQEEEIEGWKQSLIYQSQELTRREVDIEARSEELQQLEAESNKIEEQLQEFEATRAQVIQLKEDIDRDRQQLEDAWGRLHSAQQQHEQNQHSAGLSDEQLNRLETLMSQLESNLLTGEVMQGPLETLRSSASAQQSVLQQFWDQLDQERAQAESAPEDLKHQSQSLQQAWQAWHQDQDALHHLQIQRQLVLELLSLKQVQQGTALQQLQAQQEIEQNLKNLRDGVTGNVQVDSVALQEMPLDSLEETVEKLQKELEKLSHFVADQEEELKLQNQTIEDLQAQINQASEYDRMNLASDLENEQQNYRFLEETLQGQRQTLRDRESILKLHRSILSQRRGTPSDEPSDLGQQLHPLLIKISAQRQSFQDALAALEQDIKDSQDELRQLQDKIDAATSDLEQKREQLKAQSDTLDQRRIEIGQITGRVGIFDQALHPIQNHLNQVNQSIELLRSPLESAASEQQRVAAELKQTIMALGQVSG
jgi:chromosome segregation ATPase